MLQALKGVKDQLCTWNFDFPNPYLEAYIHLCIIVVVHYCMLSIYLGCAFFVLLRNYLLLKKFRHLLNITKKNCCSGWLLEHCFPMIQNLLSYIEENVIYHQSKEKEKKRCSTSVDNCTEDKRYYIMIHTTETTLMKIGITAIHAYVKYIYQYKIIKV